MRKISTVVTFFMVATCVFGGSASAMRVESPAEQILFSTVRIETQKLNAKREPTVEVATGCVVKYVWGRNESADFLVTNRHAIEGALMGRFYFIQAENGQPVLGKTYNMEMDNFESIWYKNKDKRIDIAVMPLGMIQEELKKRNWEIYYKEITENISLNPGTADRLDAIEQVIFVGYPSGLVDPTTFLPVARRGITATPLTVDYTGLPQFLIDASVFPGSSGSPVFIVNTGSYSDRRGRLVLGNRVIFLGIISSIFIRKEISEWAIEGDDTGVPALQTQQMIDIAGVYKASAIFDTIKELLREQGQIE